MRSGSDFGLFVRWRGKIDSGKRMKRVPSGTSTTTKHKEEKEERRRRRRRRRSRRKKEKKKKKEEIGEKD